MASISWSIFDGSYTIDVIYMQLSYFLKPLYMQLSYLLEYVNVLEWAHSLAWLVGWLCILSYMTCLVCRMYYGPDAIDSTAGRVFVLLGDVFQCAIHRPLTWYGERQIKYWHDERQRFYDLKDKQGITDAQNMAIGWREYLRVLQATVHNMFEEQPESADDKLFRYKNSEMRVQRPGLLALGPLWMLQCRLL